MTNTTTHTPQDRHELETLAWDVIGNITYRGCEIKRLIGGYLVLGKHIVTTKEEVDKVIDLTLDSLGKSIKQ